MTGKPVLRLAGVSKSFGKTQALSNVDMELRAGEILALLGPNGAGKSTAIECLVGLLEPDAGIVEFYDAPGDGATTGMPVVGVALQETQLHDKITPAEAIGLFAALNHCNPDQQGLLDRFGLTGAAQTRYENLSGGQRQALAIALALLGAPPILVLDEPTQGLDIGARAALHRMILSLRREGRAVLIATHDMAEAEALSDRIAILREGRLVAEGDAASLIAKMGGYSCFRLECDRPVDLSSCRHLEYVPSGTSKIDGRIRHVDKALSEIVDAIRDQSASILQLEVGPPRLEDLMLSLDAQAQPQ